MLGRAICALAELGYGPIFCLPSLCWVFWPLAVRCETKAQWTFVMKWLERTK